MTQQINFIAINRTHLRLWWFPLVAVLIIVVGTVAFLVPEITTLIELRDSQKTAAAKLTSLQEKHDQFTRLDIATINQLYETATSALPSHKPYYEVLSSISSLASSTGVTIGDFDLDPGSLATKAAENRRDGYVSLSTTLQVIGTSDQVSNFVQRLQQSLPLIEVKKIQISVSNKTAITDVRQANLDVVIYYALLNSKQASTKDNVPNYTDSLQQTYQTLLTYSLPTVESSTSSAIFDFGRSDVFAY